MPKIVDHDQRRNEIAEVTLRVIQRSGVDGATFRSIAEEGGFSRGVVPHYFKDKEQLIRFVFEWVANKTLDQIELQIAEKSPGLARLRYSLVGLLADQEAELEGAGALSFWGQANSNINLRDQQRLNYQRWRHIVRNNISEAIQLGDLAETIDIDNEADTLVSMVDGLSNASILEQSSFPIERAKQLVDGMLNKLRAPQRQYAHSAA
ncbi:HTH-type transcriptional regulator BetI [Sinobacterium norvegicum]|uniref:HTH-type transcriptional regulator BetI n=1 Tax=Sinobacterium norvegicum TaxID=1641715 RepID=A0ABM9AFM8_9GAMM|nr:TetR family transcriptional regulator C-terminal domain-containing protein [Sinobacterium norvegicum]CAH0992001.1 HTH-type transcriptional regulator BetI [Sinobacterium norvegicum]